MSPSSPLGISTISTFLQRSSCAKRSLAYFPSATSGCPADARCARIWCRRPVRMRTSSRLKAALPTWRARSGKTGRWGKTWKDLKKNHGIEAIYRISLKRKKMLFGTSFVNLIDFNGVTPVKQTRLGSQARIGKWLECVWCHQLWCDDQGLYQKSQVPHLLQARVMANLRYLAPKKLMSCIVFPLFPFRNIKNN